MKNFFGNSILILFSFIIAALIGELFLRIFLDPVDYLMPTLVSDNTFHVRVKPYSAGHDKWGLRNKVVPENGDIIAIGDSMTYGYSASREGSWPMQLEKLLRRAVYNMGMGGWGPPQYFCVFQKYGLALNPNIAIFGLYLGNDLSESYTYRDIDCSNSSLDSQMTDTLIPTERKGFGIIRDWLAQNSIFYQFIKYNFGNLIKRASIVLSKIESNNVIIVDTENVQGVFKKGTIKRVSLSRQEILIGLSVMLNTLDRIEKLCIKHDIACYYVLINTKQMAYAKMINASHLEPEVKSSILEVVEAENEVRKRIIEYAAQQGLKIIEPLVTMQNEIKQKKMLYPLTEDIHPNSNGYRVIAKEISKIFYQQPN